MKTIWLTMLVALFAVGCATTPRPTPLTQVDVISMTKAGMTDEEIIRRIDQTRSVFKLNADAVVNLRKEGVSEHVVNYMLDTLTRAAVDEERRRAYDDYDYHYRFGFFYGYPHHRWCW